MDRRPSSFVSSGSSRYSGPNSVGSVYPCGASRRDNASLRGSKSGWFGNGWGWGGSGWGGDEGVVILRRLSVWGGFGGGVRVVVGVGLGVGLVRGRVWRRRRAVVVVVGVVVVGWVVVDWRLARWVWRPRFIVGIV